MVGGEKTQRWWAPLPPPDVPAIGARRAYVEVLGVFAAFFGAGILAAGFSLATDLGNQSGGWGVWLPNAVQEITDAAVAATLVILLTRNRGMSRQALGLDWPRDVRGRVARGQALRAMTWAVVALIAGSLVISALATGEYNYPQNLNAAFLVFGGASALNAGIVEEAVVLGFVVATLRQARRPLWEVVAVALVLRCSYHIYYGPGVVGILVWASIFLWLYLRTRSLLPLMVVHFVWDTLVFTGARWGAITLFALLLVFAMVIASPITWLVERSRAGERARAAGLAWAGPGYGAAQWLSPPGWHPDPWGESDWRWWDGTRWTGATNGPRRQPLRTG